MTLNYRSYGSGPPMVILHGLFGSLDNWFSLAKAYADRHTVYLVDQRNHGQSPHADTHGYDDMAEDLLGFFSSNGLAGAVLLGHSMGGRTAMRFAALHGHLLSALIVADMGVKAYPVHHDLIIRSLQAIPLDTLASRQEAEEELRRYIGEDSTVQFLLKSLYRKPSPDGPPRFAWRFNLDVLAEEIEEVGLPILQGSAVRSLFIYGTRSRYVLAEDAPGIRALFPNASFATLDAGHWLHAEDPQGFVRETGRFLAELG